MAMRRYPSTPTSWHPMLSTHEYTPGRWVLLVMEDRAWALIDIIRSGDEIGYKVVTARVDVADRELIGYYTSFKAAAAHAHGHYLASLTPKGGVNGRQ